MFTIEQEDFTLQDFIWDLGGFGGDAAFLATRQIEAGAALDASWQASENGSVVFALVVTVATN